MFILLQDKFNLSGITLTIFVSPFTLSVTINCNCYLLFAIVNLLASNFNTSYIVKFTLFDRFHLKNVLAKASQNDNNATKMMSCVVS